MKGALLVLLLWATWTTFSSTPLFTSTVTAVPSPSASPVTTTDFHIAITVAGKVIPYTVSFKVTQDPTPKPSPTPTPK